MIPPDTALYHLCPADLRGTALLPLSALQSAHPDLYARAVAKYRRREQALRRPLPELDCLWVDCVQFSTVHPEDVRDAVRAAGLAWPKKGRRFLVIDGARLDARAACIWLYRDARPTPDMAAAKTDVVPFSLSRLAGLRSVSAGTHAYLAEMAQRGHTPLLAVGVPHVLHRGPVPLASAGTLDV